MPKFGLSATALILLLWTSFGFSEPRTVQLFTKSGEQVANYRDQLTSLSPGDTLCFDGCRYRFEFVKPLGHGDFTEILEVRLLAPHKRSTPPELALRLPLDVETSGSTEYVKFIDHFIDGYGILKRQGIHLPKVYFAKIHQFVAVERIAYDFNLEDFFLKSDSIPAKFLEDAEASLYRFAYTIATLERIGDFHAGQLVYSHRINEWILIDFSETTQRVPLLLGRFDFDPHPLMIYKVRNLRYRFQEYPRIAPILDKIDRIVNENSGFLDRLKTRCASLLIF